MGGTGMTQHSFAGVEAIAEDQGPSSQVQNICVPLGGCVTGAFFSQHILCGSILTQHALEIVHRVLFICLRDQLYKNRRAAGMIELGSNTVSC